MQRRDGRRDGEHVGGNAVSGNAMARCRARGERESRAVAPQTRRMSKQGAACLELIIKK